MERETIHKSQDVPSGINTYFLERGYDYVEYLKYEYGETWGTPIKWFDYGISKSKWIKIYVKERVKEFLPRFVLEYIVKKKEKKFEVRFRKKIEKYQEIGGSIN